MHFMFNIIIYILFNNNMSLMPVSRPEGTIDNFEIHWENINSEPCKGRWRPCRMLSINEVWQG